MEERMDVLRQYVNDMIGLERYTREAADKEIKDDKYKGHADVAALIMRLKDTMDTHITVLDSELKRLGGQAPSGLKQAAQSFLGNVAGMIQGGRSDEGVSKILRDHYTTLSLTNISYAMLETTCLSLDEPTIADLCAKNMREITPFLADIIEIVPTVLVFELQQRVEGATTTGTDRITRDVLDAWENEIMHSGHSHGRGRMAA